MTRIFSISLVLLAWLSAVPLSFAVSVGAKSDDPSPEAEQATFQVNDQFEVNLFADETMGIANPVTMNWDSRGRLWVLTTLSYAQLEPGEKPDDKIFILEDTDGDGKADKSTVFADGLNMPMGFALYEDGVYVGEQADLVLLRDTDDDGSADSREVILTGFGTGDTHQNISNFTWGPDGCLYFAQGLHCYSRVETPWGIVRGDTAGFWRFDPETLKLQPFCFPSLASQNPCGIGFDKTGAMFLKSNNRELIYVTPGLIPTTHQKSLVPIGSIGVTPGKSMAAEYVESAHLPDWLQNNILVAGYYSHRVTAFPLVPDGAGYAKVEPVELMVAGHSSFRPVEIKIGPDGAIYIADWFNPIIGHYQASLRHPDRDEQHGRIWRMTAKGRALNPRETEKKRNKWNLVKADIESENPRARLEAIIAAANTPQAESLVVALRALDHPRDQFIDYALEQTVHALAAYWLPAVKAGSLSLENPGHLAYALTIYGGDDAAVIAREQLTSSELPPEARFQFSSVLAATGTPEDLRSLISSENVDESVIETLIESWPKRKVRPKAPFAEALAAIISGERQVPPGGAIRLAGLWQAKQLTPMIRTILADLSLDPALRSEAARALPRLRGEKSVAELESVLDGASIFLQAVVFEALASLDAKRAAELAAPVFVSVSDPDEASVLLGGFLNRVGAPKELGLALQNVELTPTAAEHIATAMTRMGRSDSAILGVVQDAIGVASGARAYSAAFVEKLAGEVEANGNPAAGAEVYARVQANCIACHQIEGVGGIVGPSLDAVGAGLPVDLLIESVLWPERQMKEGYFAVAVTTKDGETFSGYREREEDGVLFLRDTASQAEKPIARLEIQKLEDIGSLMPPGLTNGMSREELRDLVAYLASLKG